MVSVDEKSNQDKGLGGWRVIWGDGILIKSDKDHLHEGVTLNAPREWVKWPSEVQDEETGSSKAPR